MHLPPPPPTPPHSPPQPRRKPPPRQPHHPVLVPPPHRRPPPRISNRTRPTRHNPIRHPHRQPRPTTLKPHPPPPVPSPLDSLVAADKTWHEVSFFGDRIRMHTLRSRAGSGREDPPTADDVGGRVSPHGLRASAVPSTHCRIGCHAH